MFDRAEYNGVKTLPLPETLDVSEFPYLIFAKGENNIIALHAFTKKVYMNEENFLVAGAGGTLRRFAIENDAYTQLADLPYSASENIFKNEFKGIFWSNWDIQYPIGSIYFYGSKPIPTTRWISHRFDADFVKKENRVIINAVQNDNSSRTFIISLLENGEKWFPPEETEIYLLYKRPDGQNGNVSNVAVLTENVVSLIPPKDVFEVNGTVLASVALKFETNTLSTFNFEIHVEKDPSIEDPPEVPDTPTGIYDDEFPIQWNSLAVQGNVASKGIIKVSNLTPTAEEMQTATLTLDGTECSFAGSGGNGYEGYAYGDGENGTELYVVRQAGDYDGISFSETGLYCYVGEYSNFALSLAQSATMYLYGHKADSVVTYNGVELPDIESVWDKETYPYAVIVRFDVVGVYFSSKPFYVDTNGNLCLAETGALCIYVNDSGWQFAEAIPEYPSDEQIFAPDDDTIVWTSHDILNADGSVHLAASEPVHSYDNPDVIIDGVGYKGAVLPELPEWDREMYPCAFIDMGDGTQYNDFCYLVYATSNCVYNGKELVCIGDSNDKVFYLPNGVANGIVDDAWVHQLDMTLEAGDTAVFGECIWTNTDFLNEDGTVYLSATEPVPVGEIVGYNYNGVTLPELPEWDKETYPYAVILSSEKKLRIVRL